jgi:hypothetical protein
VTYQRRCTGRWKSSFCTARAATPASRTAQRCQRRVSHRDSKVTESEQARENRTPNSADHKHAPVSSRESRTREHRARQRTKSASKAQGHLRKQKPSQHTKRTSAGYFAVLYRTCATAAASGLMLRRAQPQATLTEQHQRRDTTRGRGRTNASHSKPTQGSTQTKQEQQMGEEGQGDCSEKRSRSHRQRRRAKRAYRVSASRAHRYVEKAPTCPERNGHTPVKSPRPQVASQRNQKVAQRANKLPRCHRAKAIGAKVNEPARW